MGVTPRTLQIRPLAQFASEAKELGFKMMVDAESEPFTVFVRCEPLTVRAKEALRRATEDPRCDGIDVTTVFDKQRKTSPVSIPYEDESDFQRDLAVGMMDAAQTAVGMIREVLAGRTIHDVQDGV